MLNVLEKLKKHNVYITGHRKQTSKINRINGRTGSHVYWFE